MPHGARFLPATLLLSACSAEPAAFDPWIDDADGLREDRVEFQVEQLGGRNVYRVSWETPHPAQAVVAYGEDGELDHLAQGISTEGGHHHEVILAGLAGGVDWELRVDAPGKGVHYTSDAVLLQPEAPPATLPQLELTTPPTDEVRGFTLTQVQMQPDAVLAVLDRQGRYVWWQEIDHVGTYRGLFDERTQTFSWVGRGDQTPNGLYTCTIDGEPKLVTDLPDTHHDLQADPEGGWYVLAFDPRPVEEDGGTFTVYGDKLVHISPDGQTIRTVWSSWDEFPYAGESMSGGLGPEYPHTNSFTIDPETGDILLSVYLADALAMIDRTTGRARWTFSGADSDWSLQPGEEIERQHAPLLLDGGRRLAVFDNGKGNTEEDASQASFYELDWDTFTARRDWTWDDDAAHNNVRMGSVVPASAPGSALVSWGSEAMLTVVSAEGEVDWELSWAGDSFGYTEHLDSFMGATW